MTQHKKSLQLSNADKKYQSQMEKVIVSFESLEEWADYISFLSKLYKLLQVSVDSNSFDQFYIPYSDQLSYTLSLCLSLKLPNGVHQKALSIYEFIFDSLPSKTLNDDISIWIPGILPLLSYASISIKPQVIALYKKVLLDKLNYTSLKRVLQPTILCLFSGLEDENSEAYRDVFDLLNDLKTRLDDDSSFWQNVFICIIGNPEKRSGALNWCIKRLPRFINSKDQNGNFILSKEAQFCLKPDAGLLIRSFATSIDSSKTNDIVVIRGFFDLLASHLPLDCDVLKTKINSKDKELLIMSCIKLTLKKDMSLNRRLWNYILGPDLSSETKSTQTRVEYFKFNALEYVVNVLMTLVNSSQISSLALAFKLSVPLLMDKWEISSILAPKLYTPFLKALYNNDGNEELLTTALPFFNTIESIYIWANIFFSVIDEDESKLGIVEFALREFDVNEEESIAIHAPLAIIGILANKSISLKKIGLIKILVQSIPKSFYNCDLQNSETQKSTVIKNIFEWYENEAFQDDISLPYRGETLTSLLVQTLQDSYLEHFDEPSYSVPLGEILSEVWSNSSIELQSRWNMNLFVDAYLLNLNADCQEQMLEKALSATSTIKQLKYFLDETTQKKLLKEVLSGLWVSLSSSDPAYFQLECTMAISELKESFSIWELDAGLIELFSKTSKPERVYCLESLWTHTIDNDTVLDELLLIFINENLRNDQLDFLAASNFIIDILRNGDANRFWRILIDPILNLDFLDFSPFEFKSEHDLNQFSYHLNLIIKLFSIDTKLVRESLSHEAVLGVSLSKLNIPNDKKISTYKSLMLLMIQKFLDIDISKNTRIIFNDNAFSSSIKHCLKLFQIIITGSEKEFEQVFNSLIIHFIKFLKSCDQISAFEDTQMSFLDVIFDFLQKTNNLRLSLDLLHVEGQSREPPLVDLMALGIEKSLTSELLRKWVSLLVKSLYIFEETVFSVLFKLNEILLTKLELLFNMLLSWSRFDQAQNLETSLYILFDGLDDLISISHGYLSSSNFKNQQKGPQNTENGFINTMIQGVFHIESPVFQNSEQNSLYSISLAIRDAVLMGFKIWNWSDVKHQIPPVKCSYSIRSLTHLQNKLKFKSKKLLESLIELERQEVTESLILIDDSSINKIKLLNILDGGRSQLTINSLYKSIMVKCKPESKGFEKNSVNFDLNAKAVSSFLVEFLEFVDNDVILDIWSQTSEFFKAVNSNFDNFENIYMDCLKICRIISFKFNSFKTEEARPKKELADIFFKIFQQMMSNNTYLNDDTSNKSHELCELLPAIESIVQDSEKFNTLIGSLVSACIIPKYKSKKKLEFDSEDLNLLDQMGQYTKVKSWSSAVSDMFFSEAFLHIDLVKETKWNSVIKHWIGNGKEKMSDIVMKITPTSSSPSSLFVWNEISEIESRVELLKRISYLILIEPIDFFLNNLETFFEKATQLLKGDCPYAIRSSILILFRSITLKFNNLHLLTKWKLMVHELIILFKPLSFAPLKELLSYPKEKLEYILIGCKFLDQLLTFDNEEFNFNRYLFVNPDLDDTKIPGADASCAIVDQISVNHDFTLLKDDPFELDQTATAVKPLLNGAKRAHSFTQLRLFFDSLSLISYERTFSLKDPDYNSFVEDVMHDLMSED